ncbi:MAG: flagellar biosynthesis protein FlhF [Treponema sp.]|nr:flagellar biosynthesis protein FlhF [Treponema sp.]
MEQIKAKYGEDIRVVGTRNVMMKGFLGLFSHEGVELTGTYGYPIFGSAAVQKDRPLQVDLETAKRQVLAAAGKTAPESSMNAVLKEISALSETITQIKEKMDTAVSASPNQVTHPSLQKLEEDLLFNGFTSSFVKTILDRVRREIPLQELDDYEEIQKRVILWIGKRISIYQDPEPVLQSKKKPRIIVLVGPTGVGKTTTLVKLAVHYGELERSEGVWQKQVRLITLDCYRIGAEYQLKRYGEFMDVPVSTAETNDDLKKLLALYRQDVDYILVDTIGKSPRDYAELGKMKAVLDACPARTEIHLCIQASTKAADVREILKQFEPFKYKSVIITKMDETGQAGNVIGVLAEEQKSISFITTGQVVPTDIERAEVVRMLMNLDGFAIDRPVLTDHFRAIDDKGGE